MSECETVRGLMCRMNGVIQERNAALEEIKKRDSLRKELQEVIRERDAYKNMHEGALMAIKHVEKERDKAISDHDTLRSVLNNLREQYEIVTREHAALREEIARREAGKPNEDLVTVINERNNLREQYACLRSVCESITGDRDQARRERDDAKASATRYHDELMKFEAQEPMDAEDRIEMETAVLNGKINAITASCRDYEERSRHDALNQQTMLNALKSHLDSLTTSIYNRLDGPTGVEKRIVAVEAKFEKEMHEHEKRVAHAVATTALRVTAVISNRKTDHEIMLDNVRILRDRLAKLEARVSKKRVKK